MSNVKLDGPTIYKKLQKIVNAWKKVGYDFIYFDQYGDMEIYPPRHIPDSIPNHIQILQTPTQEKAPDALVVVMGKVLEEPLRVSSVDFL